MECDEFNNESVNVDKSITAVNSLILDYYKKFGRKRDLEHFFSLSTAESEIRDVTSLFWRNMKSQDSSDSGEKKSESSTELCRISIKCTIPDPSSSQDENTKTNADSESPPIITEYAEYEGSANEDNHSQRSMDAILDTSINRPLSPTSSITSQRKLEWDSLADVGYANESDRKTSASSLSTLERLALQQQYSNNDSKHNTGIGPPTAHSTPVDPDIRSKSKNGAIKKTTKIYKKDLDIFEVNVPHASNENPSQAINVNLTKHISFNMDKDGGITVQNVTNDVKANSEQHSSRSENNPHLKTDKEIQTSLTKTKDTSVSPDLCKSEQIYNHRAPVLISLNTLRKKYRRKKPKVARKKLRNKKNNDKENIPAQEKSTEQVSAAESFEYMPGHVYSQNQMKLDRPGTSNNIDNKSSLESSGAATTESSKGSKHSFTKDLEKSVKLLQAALHRQKHNDSELKNKLVKEVVQRLLKSKYRDDDSTTDFLSGLSFSSKKLGLGESRITTSTSDSNNTETHTKPVRPKKSILRLDKFNSNVLTATSQSAPNLASVLSNEKQDDHNSLKQMILNTESDISSGGKHSSDAVFVKTSSEELYRKYLEALRMEEAYKKHLRDKEIFLKQKLVSSDIAFTPTHHDKRINSKLKDLIKDLTRNNYDDGSGDASKLEGGDNSSIDFQRFNAARSQRSHSVFTLSSGNSDDNNRKANLRKRLQNEIKHTKDKHDRDDHHCVCMHRSKANKVDLTDSSVQVNLKNETTDSTIKNRMPCYSHRINQELPENFTHVVTDDVTGDIKYVCLCGQKSELSNEVSNNMLIYKCSRLTTRGMQLENTASKTSNTIGVQYMGVGQSSKNAVHCPPSSSKMTEERKSHNVVQSDSSKNIPLEKSSQTNIALRMLERNSNEDSASLFSTERKLGEASLNTKKYSQVQLQDKKFVYEATRSIQTEISINPKISDPALSDINLISESDCVKLIFEGYKEVANQNSDGNVKSLGLQDNLNKEKINEGSVKSPSVEKDRDITNIETLTYCGSKSKSDSQSEVKPYNNVLPMNSTHKEEKLSTDNFTIPIQGTNMTLMVRIGSTLEHNKNNSDKDETKTQCVGTEQHEVTEKGTCLTEECSKGVQSCATDIFTEIGQESSRSNVVSDIKLKISPRKDKNVKAFYHQRHDNLTTGDGNGNTYPRNPQPGPKPFLRSNTDTGKFVSTSCVQTDNIKSSDAITQEISRPVSVHLQESDSENNKKCNSSPLRTDFQKSSNAENSTEQKDNSSDVPSRKSSSESGKDPILDIIKDITKRYSKKDMEKYKRKKCFKEIMTVLNYLLDTEDGTDLEHVKFSDSTSTRDTDSSGSKNIKERCSYLDRASKIIPDLRESKYKKDTHSSPTKKGSHYESGGKIQENSLCNKTNVENPKNDLNKKADKAVQSSLKKSTLRTNSTESSDIHPTTEMPSTSSESATCKVLNKIKRECEKYHQKRCKSHSAKKCEASSSTSVDCDKCKRVHHCLCRGHRCQRSKSEKVKKKCVAYNLIIQTSDSMISEETMVDKNCTPLQNVVVKVPHKRKHMEKAPFKEVFTKIEKTLPCSPRGDSRTCRSRSWPNESQISSNDDYAKRNCGYSVREYLEINRPDFVEKCSNRQQCLKTISEKRANERAAQRQLLSVQLDRRPSLTSLSETELRRLAKDLGVELKRKKLAPKFISEREMKKHSEKIYKSLPEVVQKKEDARKENAKKTNLLMANIFKKNLQKKTLRGSVNLSNYSTVIKI